MLSEISKKNIEPITCLICIESKRVYPIGVCKHSFCYTCTTNWLSINSSCPVCRTVVAKSTKPFENIRGNLFSQNDDLFALSKIIGI